MELPFLIAQFLGFAFASITWLHDALAEEANTQI